MIYVLVASADVFEAINFTENVATVIAVGDLLETVINHKKLARNHKYCVVCYVEFHWLKLRVMQVGVI